MDKERKVGLAYRVALISGVFCGVVSLLLILNFWNMRRAEPLESKTIEVLVERLKQEPNNEELKQEIRSFDLLARKAYFTSKWQVKTGTWLLLFGGILLAVSLKVYTDLRAQIEEPGEMSESLLRARANAQYWLLTGGGLILGLALVAGMLSNDALADYQEGRVAMEDAGSGDPASEVEVVDVFAAGQSTPAAQSADSLAGNGGAHDDEAVAEEDVAVVGDGSAAESSSQGDAVAFVAANMKQYQATFRGYMGQGVSYHKNIPEQWDGVSGDHIKWKVPIDKHGFSSPVLWGDRIFLTGADDEARMVFCYDLKTGELKWGRAVSNIAGSPSTMPRVTDDTGLAAPTAAVDGNRVYAIFATGDIVAFNHQGTQVWGRNLGVPRNHYGHSSSLQVWGNKVIVQYDTGSGGRLLALNTSTGQTIWDVERPVSLSWSSPLLAEVGGKVQVITSSDPYVMGNDLETGAEIWKVEAMMGEVGPSPAFADGIAYAVNEYARLIGVEPKAGATYLWENDEYLSECASPVAWDGLIYIATTYGVFVCYDAKTGEKVWELEFNDGFYSSPMVADGKVYALDMDGVMHIMKADRSGTLVSEPKMGEGGFALPLFVEGGIIIRVGDYLYSIE